MTGPTGPTGGPTLLLRAYRLATRALVPLVWAVVSRKLARHGVPAQRMHERLGHASLPRPGGDLIWFHAASVGESLSVLTLIARMGDRLPWAEFLITSGTATSAEMIGQRLPPRTRHQFAPLDAPGPVGRFLSHWRPRAGIFVESELWPVMLTEARGSGARLALLNARLSEKSVAGWRKRPATARFLFGQFDLILTQNRNTADNLIAIGADPARLREGSNLKSTAAPLPVDAKTLADMRAALGGRPVWIASSTHEGEEQTVLAAHRALLDHHPDLCLLLVPRHPERGDDVARLIAATGMTSARRTRGEAPSGTTQVYLADTLGETGTWYAVSPLVFLGGSLRPIGGHNPYEPAQAGAAIVTGPGVFNFAETYPPLIARGGAVEVTDAIGLAAAIGNWLDNPAEFEAARLAASAFVAAQQSALEQVIDLLSAALRLGPDDA